MLPVALPVGLLAVLALIGALLPSSGTATHTDPAGPGAGGATVGSPTTTPAVSSTSTTAARPTASSTSRPGSTAHRSPVSAGGVVLADGLRCRSGDPLANVYHPYRLQVRRPCLVVTGTVGYATSESDGDTHLDLDLPASERSLLDAANYAHQDGQLVTEIVPADKAGCTPGQAPRAASGTYNYGICTGADLDVPPVGATVALVGPYVLDADHGWMEIHPVWAISVLSVPKAAAPATSTTRATSPSPGSAPSGGGGAWCQATAAPANDGYAGDFDVRIRSNQPYQQATASDAGDSYHYETNGSGYADVYLWHTSAGEAIAVTVGAASCSAIAS